MAAVTIGRLFPPERGTIRNISLATQSSLYNCSVPGSRLGQTSIRNSDGLLNLADWLTADSKCLDADRVILRAKRALLKAETYAGDLKGTVSLEVSSNLRLLKDVIGTLAPVG
jgi:hypothetical protein